jgi:hypothetical protein
MPFRHTVFLVFALMAIADVGVAGEAVIQDPAVPAAERPAESKPAPAARPAGKGKPPPELYFAPPPVPEFMLKKPEKPLTLEEMKRQADAAAEKEKARRAREASAKGSPAPGANAGSANEAPAQPKM